MSDPVNQSGKPEEPRGTGEQRAGFSAVGAVRDAIESSVFADQDVICPVCKEPLFEDEDDTYAPYHVACHFGPME